MCACFKKLVTFDPLSSCRTPCRNWKRRKGRKRRSGWRSRGKGGRGTKSGSARGSAATAKKRRKGRGRGTRSASGTEIATGSARGIASARGRRSGSARGSGRGVETSARVAADRERGLEMIRNETGKKMRKTSTNGGDLRGGCATRRQLTKNALKTGRSVRGRKLATTAKKQSGTTRGVEK